jgi:dienelactone hydrolase
MKHSKSSSILVGIVLTLTIPLRIFADVQPQWVIDMYEAHKYKTMAYRLLRPINFDATKKYPVVLTLHNGPAAADSTQVKVYNINNLRVMNRQFAEEQTRLDYPAYILAPQVDNMFSKADLKILQDIIPTLPSVDMSRIYVMGQSMGGGGTYVFIDADPSYFAAAIACSGDGSRVTNPAGLVNFNLWSMHGETDTTVPYALDVTLFDTMKTLNTRMKFTTFFKVGHSCEPLMIGINGTDSTVTLKNGYKTEYAGLDADPEPNTLNWMFSKSTNSNTALVSIKNDNSDLSIYFNQTNSMVLWSSTSNIEKVEVYSLSGTKMISISQPAISSIDLSSLKSGMYILRFYQQNLAIFTKKVIKTSR